MGTPALKRGRRSSSEARDDVAHLTRSSRHVGERHTCLSPHRARATPASGQHSRMVYELGVVHE